MRISDWIQTCALPISAMMAAEAAFEAIDAGREHDELTAYPAAYEKSWGYKELKKVRNVVPLVKKYGDFLGSGQAGITIWAEQLGITLPFTLGRHPDHESPCRKDLVQQSGRAHDCNPVTNPT